MTNETLYTLRTHLLSGLMLVSLFAMSSSAGSLHERNTITAPDGRLRYFHYYEPLNLKKMSPAVILLHGGSQNYNKILRPNSAQNEWLKLADEKGILLIIPNGVDPKTGDPDGNNQQWNDCRSDDDRIDTGADDVGFIAALIDWAVPKFSLDRNRIYAVGASNGGMMSYRLAYELSGKMAAVAAFVANLPEHSECKGPVKPISVFICNGTKDPLMPWGGGPVGRGGTVISATATRDFWIDFDRTDTFPAQTKHYPDLDVKDRSVVKSEIYTGGKNGTQILFYAVAGGGHSMPSITHQIGRLFEWVLGHQNHDIESVREAWSFLSNQRL